MANRFGLDIRGLAEADAAGVGELLASCGLLIESRRLAERIGRVRERPGVALVAHEWGPPSGVIVAHWAQGLLADAPVGRLDLVLVSPAERRRGVGRLLLKAAAQAARQAGCAELRMEVEGEAPDLLAFCRDSGFAPSSCGWVRPLRKRG